MPTAQQLINIAVGKLGGVTANTNVGTGESADALSVLNSMLDSWRIERLNVYQIVQGSYTWPASTTSRTIGSGGNFSATRPDQIESAYVVDSNNITRELTIATERGAYDAIPDKTRTADYPWLLFYDTAYPLGTLYLHAIPTQELTLQLNTWQVLQSFASLSINLALPPGYQFAIEHNLAMALLPYYPNTTAAQLVAPIARSSKAAIQKLNSTIGMLRLPTGIASAGRYDIYSGEFQ